MRFKLDENLPSELAAELRNLGHEADTVYDEGMAGVIDPVLIETAWKESRILLTLDKGIADLEFYPAVRHAGVVLFRPGRSAGFAHSVINLPIGRTSLASRCSARRKQFPMRSLAEFRRNQECA